MRLSEPLTATTALGRSFGAGRRRGSRRSLKFRLCLAVAIVPAAIFAQFISRFGVALKNQWALQAAAAAGTAPAHHGLPSEYVAVPPSKAVSADVTPADVLPGLRYDVPASACGAGSSRCAPAPLEDAVSDPGLRAWLQDALAGHRRGPISVAAHSALLKFNLAQYDVQAVLNSPKLFLMSTAQWRQVLWPHSTANHHADAATDPSKPLFQSALDVGAGLGHVTAQIAPLIVSPVTVTEATALRTTRLWWAGFDATTTLDVRAAFGDGEPFDVVLALNVLDRVEDPAAFLRSLTSVVAPGGLVVISLPLPYYPAGTPRGHQLPIDDTTWAGAAAQLTDWLHRRAHLTVLSVTRAPYICSGTFLHPVYTLDSAVVVTRPARPL